jgi:fatty-acyl-CoA synthase
MSMSEPPDPDYAVVVSLAGLLILHLLDRPLVWARERTIHSADARGITYPEFGRRVKCLGALLGLLGIRPGDRVGVMDWDSHRYLEAFFAIPMAGAVLHTINPRLSPDQILYTLQHAADRVLFVHADFLPLIEGFAKQLPSVEKIVLLDSEHSVTDSVLTIAGHYEALLTHESGTFEFPSFTEDTVATLFYTTGTTGDPKGVFFTHRQIVLHTLGSGLALTAMRDPFSLHAGDVYLPLTPMFHAHAWGVPYLATLLGLKQVFPGRFEPRRILKLLGDHRVTFSHCVPTVLQMLLNHPDAAGVDFSGWKVMTGGSALSKGLARRAMDRGILIMASYGMSETCPIVSVASLKPEDLESDDERRLDVLTRTGFPMPLVQASVVDTEGEPLPAGTAHVGELVLRTPWNTGGYYRDSERSRSLWRGGWLHTGDMACIDDEGYIRITDRVKDVIKIAGEWISSLELENALSQHPAVGEVAVVAVPDARWGERPHAEVVLREISGANVTERDLLHFLQRFIETGSIHKRALLLRIRFVANIPRTSVGKINKRALREALGSSLNL